MTAPAVDRESFLAALDRSLGDAARPVALHEPTFPGGEWEAVKACLDSGWVSSAGPAIERFERMLCEITGAAHAVAVVNGTAALALAYRAVGVGAG
ncbi:MAG: DegT/DnrJ/EryC1/StrS family aminotransferase, partial [Rhodothalassiaceae bacterium]